ncbi:hypothetical protein ACJROX_20640 [Pseudalkalibacillus sp. A8]|uniref:hypothetical protein n=1 Tax=Pseudalkalibacillus sp. A8 TaxID=3382641 RepID=UPI0038B4380E
MTIFLSNYRKNLEVIFHSALKFFFEDSIMVIFAKFTPFPRAIRKPPRSLAQDVLASTFTTGRGGI